jgi:tetraacyldisaccharide 4'-kinase
MRSLIEDIMYDRRRDAITLPLRLFLSVLSICYGCIVSMRKLLYDRGILKKQTVPCRVVCIGNLTAGGTGKTPIVIMTASMLRAQGVNVAVVSRGYGRSTRDTSVISDGEHILPPDRSGDEPHLIATALPGVPVVVGANRAEAAMLAYERFNPDIILLDDGFQHHRLNRDADILVMDASHPIGSEHLLPRGLLREPPDAVGRAKAVVFTRLTGTHDRGHIKRMVRSYHREIPVFWSRMVSKSIREPGSGREEGLAEISGKPVGALSNVANPESFHYLLKEDYARLVYTRVMPDHHRYKASELVGIVREACSAGAEYLVMTGKDERNLPPGFFVNNIKLRVLDIDAVLVDRASEYLAIVYPKLGKS